MATRTQQSATSLSRFAKHPLPPDVDIYNGSHSREYCNSFWGPGDDGPTILFTRMRGASKTTDELISFWNERAVIEEEYSHRLAKLAKLSIGSDEIGELRNSLDTLRIETERMAQSHLELAHKIRSDHEARTAQFHDTQVEHRRTRQAALEKKFKQKQTQEAYVQKAREKYEADCVRINSYSQQATFMTGKDLERINMKLTRARQTVQANEKDLANFTKGLLDLIPEWEGEWKAFCDSCQDLEEERIDIMKDVIWVYANDVSTICVTDDLSCERVRTALDQLDPQPPAFVPYAGQQNPALPETQSFRLAEFQRIIARPPLMYPGDPQAVPAPSRQNSIDDTPAPIHHPPANGDNHSPHSITHDATSHAPNGIQRTHTPNRSHQQPPPRTNPPTNPPPPLPEVHQQPTASSSRRSPSPRRPNRVSQPLPVLPVGGGLGEGRAQTPPPLLPTQSSKVLFYVKALYEYTATIEEEFDFQAGDVIAVTATPDDGWWSGELLDEARRVEGRNVFPSNFVCLF